MVELAWADLGSGEYASTPAALTIGVFDGLHLGHQRLLHAICSDSRLLPVVVTFQRHPAEILADGAFPGFIMSLAQKRSSLMEAGVQVVVGIDFSLEFSRMPGRVFLEELLRAFALRSVVLGHDFRCGHRMSTDAAEARRILEARGVEVQVTRAIRDGGGVISSTRIRTLIRGGNLAAAAVLLGRPYTLDISGETLEMDGGERYVALDERGLLPESRQLLPPAGNYPVTVRGDRETSSSTVTIGRNSLHLPLAAQTRIRYIELQENRVS